MALKPGLKITFGADVGAEHAKHNLVDIIFSNCLFYMENLHKHKKIEGNLVNYVKTKNIFSRKAAYNLLLILCENNQANVSYLINNGLINLMDNF